MAVFKSDSQPAKSKTSHVLLTLARADRGRGRQPDAPRPCTWINTPPFGASPSPLTIASSPSAGGDIKISVRITRSRNTDPFDSRAFCLASQDERKPRAAPPFFYLLKPRALVERLAGIFFFFFLFSTSIFFLGFHIDRSASSCMVTVRRLKIKRKTNARDRES